MKRISPKTVLKLISFWPPYFFSGVKVKSFNDDLTEVTVQLKISFWNKNYFGTHFGGSLYSMCDPFYVFIIAQHLGKDHIIWDKAAEIDFIRAVSEPVFVTFKINQEQLNQMKNDVKKAFKIEPEFETEIVTSSGKVVAKVKKRLYLRRKDAKQLFYFKN